MITYAHRSEPNKSNLVAVYWNVTGTRSHGLKMSRRGKAKHEILLRIILWETKLKVILQKNANGRGNKYGYGCDQVEKLSNINF